MHLFVILPACSSGASETCVHCIFLTTNFLGSSRMHTPVAPQLSATSAGKRLTLLHRMAWICAVLVLVITSLSAFIRLSKAGLGCEPWPQCYGQELRAQQQGAEPAQADAATAAARLAHRVIASTALLLILVMVMTALASRPALWPEGRLTLWLLFLALFLAVLGRWTSDARLPAVPLGNLLGGFAMFAVSVRLALVTSRPPTSSPAPDRLAGWACWGPSCSWPRWRWAAWSAQGRPA